MRIGRRATTLRSLANSKKPNLIWLALAAIFCASLSVDSLAKSNPWARCHDADLNERIAGCTDFLARGNRETKSNRITAYVNRSGAHRESGEFESAIADLDKALKLDPNSAFLLSKRGSIYQARGDIDKALADFDRAIALDPKSAAIHVDRGEVYRAKGDIDRAIADFSSAIELDPNSASAFFNRGNAYFAKNDLQNAKEDFETAWKLDPELLSAKKALDEIDALIVKKSAPKPAPPASPSAGGRSVISFGLWTFALQIINFAILVWLLHRFLYRPVLRMIDARRAELEAQQTEIARAEGEAKARLMALDAERAGIVAERAAALNVAAAEAERMAAAHRAQAEREASALLGEARTTLAVERDQARTEARKEALDLGMGVARRLLGEVPVELRAEAWLTRIERYLAGLSDTERSELCDGANGAGALRVVSAIPLPEPIATDWRARLHRALRGEFRVVFEVDNALVAGAELHFPQAILHFSWRNALAAMQAEIETHGHPS